MAESGGLTQPQSINDLLLFRINRVLTVGGAPVIRLCEGVHGISRCEWRLLVTITAAGGLMQSQLAQHTQFDWARISKAITSLVQKNWCSAKCSLAINAKR